MSLRVVRPGPLTLVQDDGRPGLGAQGVGAAGAFDRRALRHVRALLGTPARGAAPGTAALEVLGGDLVLEADADHVVAVTGAAGALDVDGRPVPVGRAVPLRAGSRVRLGPLTHGMRAYLGVAGGFHVDPVLGSRSADSMSRLGPAALAEGDVLAVGPPTVGPPTVAEVPLLLTPGTTTVEVVLGPRDDWFTDAAVATFLATGWRVSPRSDRIGVRLDGPPLERAVDGELASEPCVRGSVQVTSAGLPVVLGPDHPVTGGYPVVGVVTADGVDALAQVRPGEVVRFVRRSSR